MRPATGDRIAAAVGQLEGDKVALAQSVLDALQARDTERLIELSDPEVEWHSFFSVSENGVYIGDEGTRRFQSDVAAAFESVRYGLDGALEIDDLAVLVGRIWYQGQGCDEETESPAGWMLKFRDGKLLCYRAFRDPARALECVAVVD